MSVQGHGTGTYKEINIIESVSKRGCEGRSKVIVSNYAKYATAIERIYEQIWPIGYQRNNKVMY